MTTPREALAALLAAMPRCEGYGGESCHKPATHSFNCDGRRSCLECGLAQEDPGDADNEPIISERDDEVADAIEQAERALDAAPTLTIEAWDPNSGMSRICVNGLDHMAVDADTVAIVTKVAEALGARVVRR